MSGINYNEESYIINSNSPDPYYFVNPAQTLFGTGATQGVLNEALSGFTGGSGSTWGLITGTLSNQLDLNTALSLLAPLASPGFTGVPTAPTASANTNSTQLASTAFVQAAFTANTIYFSSGTFNGLGTSGSPYSIGTGAIGISNLSASGSPSSSTYLRGDNTWAILSGGGGGSPGGASTNVQVNVSSAFTGYSTFTYDGTNLETQVAVADNVTITPSITLLNSTVTTGSGTVYNSPALAIGHHYWNGADYSATWEMYAHGTNENSTFTLGCNAGGFSAFMTMDIYDGNTNIPGGITTSLVKTSYLYGNPNATPILIDQPFTLNTSYTVGTLPSVSLPTMNLYVTDALSPVIGSVVMAGGSAKAMVWWNGANWTVTGV